MPIVRTIFSVLNQPADSLDTQVSLLSITSVETLAMSTKENKITYIFVLEPKHTILNFFAS